MNLIASIMDDLVPAAHPADCPDNREPFVTLSQVRSVLDHRIADGELVEVRPHDRHLSILDRMIASPDLPPLPWTSPALLVAWPNEASDPAEIRDARGRPVLSRNWREVCAAIAFMVTLANREHRAKEARGG